MYVWEDSNYASLAVSFTWIVNEIIWRYRSRGPHMVFTLGALKILWNFAGKILLLGSLRKLQALTLANLLKRDSNRDIFLWNWQDFQELFFTVHLRWLVFKISNSNILFKDFSGIPVTYNQSFTTCNSHNDKLYLKMHSFTKNVFR